ncbi:MAG: murein biosynthesis integral membrane protein MurJ [bacterium]|nr:murein biosynthesis integral membrane protein MurJ [bacterium]
MTLLLALSSLISRLLGLFRNHELANVFGTTPISDAYFAAFQVPDTLYRLLIFGAISASFVPLFLSLRKNDSREAWAFVSTVLNVFLAVVLLVGLIIFMFSEAITGFLYPALPPETQALSAQLLRIMVLSPILFTFSSIFAGVQNAFRSFWGFAMAPILYNAGIIFGILALAPRFGIQGVAYGVVLGAFLHAFIQGITAWRLGFHWNPLLITWSQSMKKLFVTAVPRILSMASVQINFFIEGVIATALLGGSLTVLRYAQDIQSFPIGVIGVSFAISSFSLVSQMAIEERHHHLAKYLRQKLNHILFLTVPAAFGLYALREPLIELFLGGGSFGGEAVTSTARTLSVLCIGLIPAAVYPLIVRVFFAFHDTVWPFVISVSSVIINTLLALELSKDMGVAGVGLASSISVTLAVLACGAVLRWKYLREGGFFSISYCFAFLVASIVMTACLQLILSGFTWSERLIPLLLQLTGLVALGMLIYAGMMALLLKKQFLILLRELRREPASSP